MEFLSSVTLSVENLLAIGVEMTSHWVGPSVGRSLFGQMAGQREKANRTNGLLPPPPPLLQLPMATTDLVMVMMVHREEETGATLQEPASQSIDRLSFGSPLHRLPSHRQADRLAHTAYTKRQTNVVLGAELQAHWAVTTKKIATMSSDK